MGSACPRWMGGVGRKQRLMLWTHPEYAWTYQYFGYMPVNPPRPDSPEAPDSPKANRRIQAPGASTN